MEARNSGRTGSGGLWIAFSLLLCALMISAAYAYRSLRDAKTESARLPEVLQALPDLSKRITAVETAIGSWASDNQVLLNRVVKLEGRFKSNLQQVHRDTQEMMSQLEQRTMSRMEERDALVDARLSQIDRGQSEGLARVARLEKELASTQQEISSLRQTTNHDLAGLNEQLGESDHKVDAVAHRLERQRVNFEVTRNHQLEITPFVALDVQDTDVRHQRFSGWVQVLPESRFLWVNEHGIQQPVTFYRGEDQTSFDLVVTRVASNSVVGYLMMPAGTLREAGTPSAWRGEMEDARSPVLRGAGK